MNQIKNKDVFLTHEAYEFLHYLQQTLIDGKRTVFNDEDVVRLKKWFLLMEFEVKALSHE